MSFLQELLDSVKKLDLDEQVRRICDQITEEEILSKNIDYLGPRGPNIFLSLGVGVNNKDIHYLCLERDEPGKYIVTGWRSGLPPSFKRVKVWEINGVKAEVILREYAKYMKFLKGDM